MDLQAARRLARTLMTQHGVGHWRFEWDNSVRRFGACHFGSQKITASRKLTELNDADEFKQTMLHEIAHALAGPRANHGPHWKAVARRIGYTGRRTHNATTPERPWIGKCPMCPAEFPRHRRTRNAFHPACAAKAGYKRGDVPESLMIVWVANDAVRV